jgi:SAM-dependent methyltransferase
LSLQADSRADDLRRRRGKPKDFIFIHGDASDVGTIASVDALSGSGPVLEIIKAGPMPGFSEGGFDMSLCHFALHYFCDDENRVFRVLDMVARLLKPGSRFVCSFPNPFHIGLRFRGNEADAADTGALCSIRKSSPDMLEEPDLSRTFGVEYMFTLGDAVQNCKEYVVPIRRLVELARSVGLQLVCLQPMHDYIMSMCHDTEVVSLYACCFTSSFAELHPLSHEFWCAGQQFTISYGPARERSTSRTDG